MNRGSDSTPVEGMGYDGELWALVDDNTKRPVRTGMTTNWRGVAVEVVGGKPPYKGSSQGHVYVGASMFYASVINATWMRAREVPAGAVPS